MFEELMHIYRVVTDPDELEKILKPVFAINGSEIPAKGNYIAAVEFDEDGSVIAYQMLQTAVFLEGLWSRDNSSHLLRLHNMISEHAAKVLGVKGAMTMTRNDETGNRIGRLAEKLGFKKMNWNIYRRES